MNKVLYVNLSAASFHTEPIDPKTAELFLGGRGFGICFLFEHFKKLQLTGKYENPFAEVNPLSADNVIVIATSPATGTQMPASGRVHMNYKSPLTGALGSTNAGGRWAVEFKKSGYDVLVLTGKAAGIGRHLAKGSYRFCERYGHKELSMSVKKLELPAYDPRTSFSQALCYEMNNRGGCHLQGGYTAPHAYCAGYAEWPADRIEGTPLIAKDKQLFLRFLGTDSHEREEFLIGRIQKSIMDLGKDKFFPVNPGISEIKDSAKCEINDPSVREDFRIRLNYNYRQSIGAFGTGSMSHKISSREMIFCSMSAVPENFEFPLYRTTICFQEDDSLDLRLHKLIYQNTHQCSCMITSSPLATAEGMAILAEEYGMEVLLYSGIKIPYLAEDHPVVKPIDGEAIYQNPRVGLVDMSQLADMTPDNPILNMLRRYKGCCIVAGYAVISTGEATLEQAAHNAASAERIAKFRSEVFINEKLLNGPSVAMFEPK